MVRAVAVGSVVPLVVGVHPVRGGKYVLCPGAGPDRGAVAADVAGTRLWLELPLGAADGGKVTSTARPPPGRVLTGRVASCAAAMAWTMDRPRPWPSGWPVRPGASRWKGWRSRSIWLSGTGGPVLATSRTGRPALRAVTISTRPP